MHVFQDMPREEFQFEPFTSISSKWALLTSGDKEKANAMTIAWGSVGYLWNKDVATVYVRNSRYTKEFIDKTGYFTINFFPDEYKAALKYLGTVSGRNEDKIKMARLHLDYDGNIPYIDEATCILVCKVMFKQELDPENFYDASEKTKWYSDGDLHMMYVAEITKALAR